jgi:hypothetical protein
MTIQYLTNLKGKKTGVLLTIKDWEKIQKKLNTEQFYDDFRNSLREIQLHKKGKLKLKDASELFHAVVGVLHQQPSHS